MISAWTGRRYRRALEAGRWDAALRLARRLGVRAANDCLDATLDRGSAALVRELLLRGASAGADAAERGRRVFRARKSELEPLEKVKALFAGGARPDDRLGPQTLLNAAILAGDDALFELLIAEGGDPSLIDRSGFAPMQMARVTEREDFAERLGRLGVAPNEPSLLDLEALFINDSSLVSELHTLVKWAIRNSGFELDRVTLPPPEPAELRIRYRFAGFQIELEILGQGEIALLLFTDEATTPVSLLPPGGGSIDSRRLRGHVVSVLKELKARGRHIPPEPEELLPERSSAEIAALAVLGLSSRASTGEILDAYRRLAKRYHPDVAPAGADQMIRINAAYELLRKGRAAGLTK